MKELKTFTTGKGTYDSFPDKTARETLGKIPEGFKQTLTGKAGQILEITEVDEDGNVTGVKAVDKPIGGGNDSGQNANSGLSPAAAKLLITILRECAAYSDQTANIDALEALLTQGGAVQEGVSQSGSVLTIISGVTAVQDGDTLTIT